MYIDICRIISIDQKEWDRKERNKIRIIWNLKCQDMQYFLCNDIEISEILSHN
jgi:hypothetical protein